MAVAQPAVLADVWTDRAEGARSLARQAILVLGVEGGALARRRIVSSSTSAAFASARAVERNICVHPSSDSTRIAPVLSSINARSTSSAPSSSMPPVSITD